MSAPAVPRPNVPGAAVQTKADRYALLMSELRAVADYASSSPALTEELLARATAMLRDLSTGTFFKHAPAPKVIDPAEQVRRAAEQANRERNADASSLHHVLGLTRQPDLQVTDEEWFNFEALGDAFLLGKDIAYKYSDLGRGGWFIGKLVHMHGPNSGKEVVIWSQDGQQSQEVRANFAILFYADNARMDVALRPFNRAVNPYYESANSTWVLLKEKGMDDSDMLSAGARILAPEKQKTKGRDAAKRKAPDNAGPTGRQAQRDHGRAAKDKK